MEGPIFSIENMPCAAGDSLFKFNLPIAGRLIGCMRREAMIAVGVALALFFVFAGFSAADVATYCAGVRNKLDRGVCNFLGAPILEIPYQVCSTAKKKNVFAGVTVGVGKGAILMPLRFLSGMYDILTFPLPFPRDFGSLIKPEYIPWQDRTSTE